MRTRRLADTGVSGYHLNRALIAHVKAIIAAQHDPVGTDEVDQVRECSRRMADSVVVEPSQIFEWTLVAVGHLRTDVMAMVETSDDIGKYSAGMGKANIEFLKPV